VNLAGGPAFQCRQSHRREWQLSPSGVKAKAPFLTGQGRPLLGEFAQFEGPIQVEFAGVGRISASLFRGLPSGSDGDENRLARRPENCRFRSVPGPWGRIPGQLLAKSRGGTRPSLPMDLKPFLGECDPCNPSIH
jgi:hypothetical protein